MSQPDKPLSDVERIKSASRHLRGSLAESLVDRATGAIAVDDTQLSKFHGIYQQDDRDIRAERRQQKLEPAYSFMIRARVPGGIVTPQQWLTLDDIARQYGGGSLRLTTRQAIQYHGVIKRNLKQTIADINGTLLDTIAACGDVNRNVMCTPNPVEQAAHADVFAFAAEFSEKLTPQTRAYHEIWLDGEKVETTKEEAVEPIYGDTYLPRKFKTAVAIPPRNDVDVFAHDLGFIAIIEDGQLQGFNISVGGGMGMTHGEPATYPRLGSVIGYVPKELALQAGVEVVTIQRDYGDRSNRKHARLKYTIDDRGVEWFREELNRRLGVDMESPREFEFESRGDRYGWVEGLDGNWHLTLFVQNGRLIDSDRRQFASGTRAIAQLLHDKQVGDLRITANQNLIVANVPSGLKDQVETLARQHALLANSLSGLRKNSMACVGFPTCALSMAESERYLPTLVEKLEAMLMAHGLEDDNIVIRMTGCPNGCARPYVAEIGLVGKAPGRYNLYLGADYTGQRLNKLYRENIDEATILSELEPLIARYADERQTNERFGDFLIRTNVIAAVTEGRLFHVE